MPSTPLRIAVVGGSLGGLTAALLLRDAGHDVHVYERSSAELKSRGAGIVVVEPTFRYFTERAGRRLDDVSTAVPRVVTVAADGEVLLVEERPHRFTSWSALHGALRASFDADRYRLSTEVVGTEDLGSGARVRFGDGSSDDVDLVIAADGIGSGTRRRLLPDVEPAYAGYVAWRSAVPSTALDADTRVLVDDAMVYQLLDDSHVLVYPIPAGVGGDPIDDDGTLINLVWYRNVDGPGLDDLMVDATGRRQQTTLQPGMVRPEHAERFRDDARSRLAPVIASIAELADEPFVQVVRDVEVPRMRFGRVVLMGDAAFAARPHAAAGTAKAAADAWALAEAIDTALSPGGDLDLALGAWEERQLGLGSRLVARTRRLGEASQFGGGWSVGDPDLRFGLYEPGR
jgi:2,6-dihydroxypyridine 3-monooxygenase